MVTDTYPDGAPRTHYDGSEPIACPVCAIVFNLLSDGPRIRNSQMCPYCANQGHWYRLMNAGEFAYRAPVYDERGYPVTADKYRMLAGILQDAAKAGAA